MASTKIQNLPLKAPIGAMKIPTGGFGDYSITVSSIGDFIIDAFNLATKDYVDNLLVEKEDRIDTTGGYLTPVSQNSSVPDTTNDVIDEVAQALLDRIEYVKDNFSAAPSHNELTGRSATGAHPSTSISHKSGTVYTYLQQNESDINNINNVSIPTINQTLLNKQDLIETGGALTPVAAQSPVPSVSHTGLNSAIQALLNRSAFFSNHNNLTNRSDSNSHPSTAIQDGNESQKQINDKTTQVIKSRDLLKSYNPRFDGQVIYLESVILSKNKGGGYFKYNLSSTKSEDKGIVISSDFGGKWERIITETYHNVQWWGALGDGVDDTDAIWDALKAHGSYTFNNLSNPTNASFCSIYFPASEGTYVITRPIQLLPYMRLIGDSTKGGSLWGNSANWKSVIETRFPLAENYEWAISTMNYVRSTGQPTAWDSNYSGNNYDSGIVTGCFGASVQDIVLVNFDTTKRVYGGIRMQNSPQCSVVDCYVQGFDFCVYSSGSWDSRFDVGTVSYKCGFGCYGDMNNARINGYHHGTKDGLAPMSQQHPTSYISDSTSGLENYTAWVNYKYGVVIKYAYGFTSQNLIAEYHDVGIVFNQSTGTTGAIYTEKNTRGIATVSANVNIGSISGVRNDYSFAFGTGSKVEVSHMVTDNFLTSARDASNSQYNSEIIIPASINFNGYNVFHKNIKNIVYVSATVGSDTNNGLTASNPVATIGKAIDLFQKQRAYDTSVRDFLAGRKRIVILDSSSYTITTTQAISGDWEIECVNASKATLSWGVAYWALTNAQLRMKNVNLTRAVGNNGLGAYMTGAIISSTGNNTLTIDNADVNINGTYALISMHKSTKGNLNLDISGGTFTTNDDTAKIVENLNTSTNYLIKFGIVTTLGSNLSGRSDKGIDVPTANIITGIVR